MAVAEAKENLALDLLVSTLGTIGPVGASWLTDPTVSAGVPPDAVPRDLGMMVYVHHVRTDLLPPDAGTANHYFRAIFHAYLCSADADHRERDVLNLKADALQAVFAAEGAFTTAFKQPLYPAGFIYRDDMRASGVAVGVQEFTLDLELSHTAT
jgi:hypothetical protein